MSTKIEWTDETWNPITGCTKISPGCKHCYAERMARRLAGRYGYPEAPHHFDVTLHPDRLEQPLKWRKPRRIFVCSMGDLFHEDVPTHFIIDVWRTMRDAPQHTFQILTKRPYPMLSIITDLDIILPNVWLGVSVENQWTADERIPILLQTPAAVRFVSCEPLLGPVDLTKLEHESLYYNALSHDARWIMQVQPRARLDWVIVGGESGPGARPMHPDWVRSVRDQCQAAGTPFFFKQWGAWIPQILLPDIVPHPNRWGTLDGEGNWFPLTTPWNGRQGEDSPEREYVMIRIGKKRAGCLLDGREVKEWPNLDTN